MLQYYADCEKLLEHLIHIESEINMIKELLITVEKIIFITEVHETRGQLTRIRRELQEILDSMIHVKLTLDKLVEDMMIQKRKAIQQINQASEIAFTVGKG